MCNIARTVITSNDITELSLYRISTALISRVGKEKMPESSAAAGNPTTGSSVSLPIQQQQEADNETPKNNFLYAKLYMALCFTLLYVNLPIAFIQS